LVTFLSCSPSLSGIPENTIKSTYDAIHLAKGRHPVELHLAPTKDNWPKARKYADHCDVLAISPYAYWGIDLYQKGFKLPDRILGVSYWTDEAVRLASGKPVWVILQAHIAWGMRPTPAQLRAMAYLAVNHGASGVLLWGYKSQLWEDKIIGMSDPKLHDLRKEANRVAGELKRLSPAILGGPTGDAVEMKDDAGVVDMKAYADGDQHYIIAVNASDQRVRPSFQVRPQAAPAITLLGETRTLSHRNGTFTDSFAPYDTHVYVLRIKGVTDSRGAAAATKTNGS
jgi:hypothetical protein